MGGVTRGRWMLLLDPSAWPREELQQCSIDGVAPWTRTGRRRGESAGMGAIVTRHGGSHWFLVKKSNCVGGQMYLGL